MGVIPHIYSLPAASSLKVVLSTDAPREAAADICLRTGQIAGSQETGWEPAKADIDNPEAGFWTLLWKQPSRGAVSDVWLKIDSDGPKWVIVDPGHPVIPAGGPD